MLKRVGWRTGLLVGLVLGLAVAGGVGWAAVPASNGLITGCYNNKTGALRIIDISHAKCAATETQLKWNNRGAPGETGATGPRGIQGSPASVARIRVFVTGAVSWPWFMTWSGVNQTKCAPAGFPILAADGSTVGCSFLAPVGSPIDMKMNAPSYNFPAPCQQPAYPDCVFTVTGDTDLTVLIGVL